MPVSVNGDSTPMQSDAHRDFKKSRSETYPMEKHQLYTEVGDLKSIFSFKKKKRNVSSPYDYGENLKKKLHIINTNSNPSKRQHPEIVTSIEYHHGSHALCYLDFPI